MFFTSIAALAFFTISIQEVNAATSMILEGEQLNGLTDTHTTKGLEDLASDNDNGTFVEMGKYTAPRVFEFTEPVNINHVYLNTNDTYDFRMVFYAGEVVVDTLTRSVLQSGSNVYDVDYSNVTKVTYTQFSTTYSEVYEIEFYSYLPDSMPPAAVSNLTYQFNEDNSINYTFDFPTDADFSHLEIYQDGELLQSNYKLNSLKITDLTPKMTYNFKFVSVDTSGNKSEEYISTVTMPDGPDLIAPLDLTNLEFVTSDSSINFTYLLPTDSDFNHLMIYRNNVLVGDTVNIASFNDVDLEPETTYNYVFKAVDFTGNVSNGYNVTITTMPYNDLTPPAVLDNVNVQEGNSSLFVSWTPSTETDVAGYNVYVNGVKQNAALVNGSSYSVTNLKNGETYDVQVTAVDSNGNESEKIVPVAATPDKSELPVFKLNGDLTDVGMSIENWFSEIWVITAFAIGLPLAFLVGRRIKGLFFA